MFPSKLIGAGTFLLVALSLAQSQPPEPLPIAPPPRERIPEAPLGLLYNCLGNLNIQAELKLTPDQAKRLLAARQRTWDERFTTTFNDYGNPSFRTYTDAVAAFRAILTAEQYTRAEQLAWQRAWQPARSSYYRAPVEIPFAAGPPQATDLTRLLAFTHRNHPDLTSVLNLTAEQRKYLDADYLSTDHFVLLTSPQIEMARKFMGKPATIPKQDDTTPSDNTWFEYKLLLLPSVTSLHKVELKLTAEQSARIGKLRLGGPVFLRENSPTQAIAEAQINAAEAEIELSKILTAEQLARLKQLATRKRATLDDSNKPQPLIIGLASEIGATDEQQKQFATTRKAHAEAIARATTLTDYADALRTIRTANDERDRALRGTLTHKQRDRFNELVGEPPANRPAMTTNRQKGETLFGRYNGELQILANNKSIQTELKLSEDQIDVARQTYRDFNKLFGPVVTRQVPPANLEAHAAARSKFIDDGIKSILDAIQSKRFRGLMMQRREYDGRGVSSSPPWSAFTYPGVAEELKLTAEQKSRLLDGERAAAVLDAAQWKTFRAMLGERYAGGYRNTFGGVAPKTRTTTDPTVAERDCALFLNTAPWDGLALKREETDKLADTMNWYNRWPKESGKTQTNPWTKTGDAKAKQENAIKIGAFDRELKRVLPDPVFHTQLAQLMHQSRAAKNLRDALYQPEVMKALDLTPLQLVLIDDAEDEAVEVAKAVTAAEPLLATRDAIYHKLRDQLDVRTMALLTPDQRAKWKELTGEPFAGFEKPPITGAIKHPTSSP